VDDGESTDSRTKKSRVLGGSVAAAEESPQTHIVEHVKATRLSRRLQIGRALAPTNIAQWENTRITATLAVPEAPSGYFDNQMKSTGDRDQASCFRQGSPGFRRWSTPPVHSRNGRKQFAPGAPHVNDSQDCG